MSKKRPPNWHPSPLLYVVAALVGVAAITAVSAATYRGINNLIHAEPGAQRTIGITFGILLGSALVILVVTALLWGEPPWIHGLVWVGIFTLLGCASATSLVLSRDAKPYSVAGLFFFLAAGVLAIPTSVCWEDRDIDSFPGFDHEAWWRAVDDEQQRLRQETERLRQERAREQERVREQSDAIKPDVVKAPSVQDIYRKVSAKDSAA